MKISLIMATYGRYDEIKEFLNSLLNQSYKNYELIIVDQNDKISLEPIIKEYSGRIDIKYLTSEKGLSRARNVGLNYVTGDIVGFPDDDCVYSPETLNRVYKEFSRNEIDGIVGQTVPTFSNKLISSESKKAGEGNLKQLNIYNVWFHGISYTIFLSKGAIEKIGIFDEQLGVGSGTRYGSGEETDYLIRGIKLGLKIFYDKELEIKHPEINMSDRNIHKKAYSYSIGRMYVLRKHRYNKIFILANIIYPILKLICNVFSRHKVRYFWYQFLGRIENVR